MTVRRFLSSARAGATGIAAAAVSVMAVGGAALIGDHLWLVDQRDVLKTATDAAGVAATLEMHRVSADLDDAALEAVLTPIARRYVLLNLSHLPDARRKRAEATLALDVRPNRAQGTVDVDAKADLGGTLLARRIPLLGRYAGEGRTEAHTGVECTTNVVEVAFALDITGSMSGSLDKSLPNGPENNRRTLAVAAAKALVDTLYEGCATSNVAMGVVPWDKTVRVPDPSRWERESYVRALDHPRQRYPSGESWTGCVEDRAHSEPLEHGLGLSLEPPGPTPGTQFPRWFNPDSRRYDPTLLDGVHWLLEDTWPEELSDRDARAALIVGQNDWDRTGGPNYHCTQVPILPLTTDRSRVDAVLDRIDGDIRLLGGGTLAHLGISWGRWLLAPQWRAIWHPGPPPADGAPAHPVDPAHHPQGHVVKALVLLTDGLNALEDASQSLPGRFAVRKMDDGTFAHLPFRKPEWDCADAVRSGAVRTEDCVDLEHLSDDEKREHFGGTGWLDARAYATRYSALGLSGEGRSEDGHHRAGGYLSDMNVPNITQRRDELDELLETSCELARDEGLTVFIISLIPESRSNKDQIKDTLVKCAGTSATTTTQEKEQYFFKATDRDALMRAFRAIGQRLLAVRRTS